MFPCLGGVSVSNTINVDVNQFTLWALRCQQSLMQRTYIVVKIKKGPQHILQRSTQVGNSLEGKEFVVKIDLMGIWQLSNEWLFSVKVLLELCGWMFLSPHLLLYISKLWKKNLVVLKCFYFSFNIIQYVLIGTHIFIIYCLY